TLSDARSFAVLCFLLLRRRQASPPAPYTTLFRSRYMRMAGHEVLMVSGSDEHGTPILVLADTLGTTARELVDTHHATIAHELARSEEQTSELQSRFDLVCRPVLEQQSTAARLSTT